MNRVDVITTVDCLCGGKIHLIGSRTGLAGIHGKYATDGGQFTFMARAECRDCGLIYEADHNKFAPYYNMLVHRLHDWSYEYPALTRGQDFSFWKLWYTGPY